jgi:hypothetical protein
MENLIEEIKSLKKQRFDLLGSLDLTLEEKCKMLYEKSFQGLTQDQVNEINELGDQVIAKQAQLDNM